MQISRIRLSDKTSRLHPFAEVHAQTPPPNIIVVMGDDIGWANIGV